MKSKRRDFLKLTGIAGLGLAGNSILKGHDSGQNADKNPVLELTAGRSANSSSQQFNMSGFSAPKIDIVRVGIIGLGNRGPGHMNNLSRIMGVEIKALCDLRPEKAEAAKTKLAGSGHNPDIYTGNEDSWKKLCERKDLDLVIVTTPWYMHAKMAVYAMEQGKHVASEVALAATMEECWQLVETAERTRKHCMMMANYAYNEFQLRTLNMARQGYLGDIVHGEGGYIANKIKNNFSKDMYWDMWWLKQYANRKGNIYPIHGFESLCQVMDINRGDKLDFLVSVESKDFKMGEMAKELASKDPFYEPFAQKDFRGNINNSIIKTSRGRTIIVQHDATTDRPYTLKEEICGTLRSVMEYPRPSRISNDKGNWVSPEEFKSISDSFTPNILKKMGDLGKDSGSEFGADLLMSWRLIDCLHNGLPLDMDVYDGVSWSSVLPLSDWSVRNRSYPVDIPDFTAGLWKSNKRNMDITLAEGGNTKLRPKSKG
jgi:hypothetical protein